VLELFNAGRDTSAPQHIFHHPIATPRHTAPLLLARSGQPACRNHGFQHPQYSIGRRSGSSASSTCTSMGF